MANGWEDDGAWWSASRVPTNAWFPVDTATGAWDLPGQPTPAPTLGAVSGADLGLDLDLTTPWPGAGQGYGVRAPGPPAIGQGTGLGAPTRATPSALPGRPTRESLRAFLPQQPGVWESIARGVGMATSQGRAILQGYDQQQQGLTNRLALRRQQMLEDQEARQVVKEEYSAFADLSKIKNKALRNLQFDRIVAQKAEAGAPLPADFVEAFKKSSLVEGEGLVQAYGHLLQKTGFSPEQVTSILENSDAATIKDLLEGTIKVRQLQTEEAEAKALQRIQAGGTLGEVSGVPQPSPPSDQRPRGYVEAQTTQPIVGSEKLAPTFTVKATEVANRLQMNPQDLLRIISFETGGTFNPAERNRAGSGATGLIQFTEQTAKALGTTTAALAKMSPEEQLDYVEKYLTPYKGKLGNLKDAYLAVLKPAALGQGLDAPLFTKDKDGLAYTQNAGLDTGGKGHVTVGDALGAVMRTTTGGGTQAPAPDTRMQVAGPGAPAPTTPPVSPADQAALTRLKEAIATKQRQIQQLSGLSSERANKVADNMRADLKILQDQHDRLEDRMTETPRAVAKEEALGKVRAREATARDQAQYQEKQRQQAMPMLPEDRRKLLTGLRSDIRQEPTFKIYQDVRNGYQNVQIGAKRDSSEGDLALIYGLAKILDPGSVVRESEFATVAAAQGKLQQLLNTPQRFFEGDRLTPANRQKLLSMAQALAQEKLLTAQKELRAVYEPLAKEGNIAFDQLLPLGDLKTPEGQSLLEEMQRGK